MTKTFCLSCLLILFNLCQVAGQTTELLRQKIQQIIATKSADIGVSISVMENNDSLSVNGSKKYPLLSVLKFPLGLAVLDKVDKGELNINQKVFIDKSELLANTWSPIRKKYPNRNLTLSLGEILDYTVGQSDNNGCDILLRLIGGTSVVQEYIKKIGIDDFVIKVNEEEMHKGFEIQRINTTSPLAATELLKKFYAQKILSKKSTDFLCKIMSETATGMNRIKAQLPKETPVAHKMGTSDTNQEGLTIAVNDIGIMTLANGKHIAISVFVSNSKENKETNEKIIADISKLAWNHYRHKRE